MVGDEDTDGGAGVEGFFLDEREGVRGGVLGGVGGMVVDGCGSGVCGGRMGRGGRGV